MAEPKLPSKLGLMAFFYVEAYESVIGSFCECLDDLSLLPQPEKPVGSCTFDQYKAIFRKTYKV